MADKMSNLPEELLIHILSFVTTKESIRTSILSKRWKNVWRSVPYVQIEDYTVSKDTYSIFARSVYAFISTRDVDQPLQRLHLKCSSSLLHGHHVNQWVAAATQHRLEYLDISVSHSTFFMLSSSNPILSCNTLSVLKLNRVSLLPFSFVNLPSLKTLHLYLVRFPEHSHLAQLLSATPNLEVLALQKLYFKSHVIEAQFKRLPKLVSAVILGAAHVPLEVINNVEFLKIDSMDDHYHLDLIPDFQNLTSIELVYQKHTKDWPRVFEVVKHCPNLRKLAIKKRSHYKDDGEAGWPYPQDVPLCISLHLKRCYLKNYSGSQGELRFASYILQNASHLSKMRIFTKASEEQERLKMLEELNRCTKRSRTCKLSFKCFGVDC